MSPGPGVDKGAFVAAQLLLAILISSLLTLTTSPLRLAHGLEKTDLPLKTFPYSRWRISP